MQSKTEEGFTDLNVQEIPLEIPKLDETDPFSPDTSEHNLKYCLNIYKPINTATT